MTNAEDPRTLAHGARAALEAVGRLDDWLCELRADLATEALLSRPSVRRTEGAISELEDLLAEARSALVVLAFEGAREVTTCRELVVNRCREILATWECGMAQEEARSADRARDFFAGFRGRLADALEQIVESLYPQRKHEEAAARRAEEERRILARTDLPLM